MIKHVVCQKFADKKDASMAAEMLRGLMGQIPTLRSMEVGLDYMGSARSYDLVLIATFDDEQGLLAYDEHPKHQEVRSFIRARRTGTVSVDYKVES